MSTRQRQGLTLPHPAGGELRATLSWSAQASEAVVYVHGFGSVRGGQKATALERECAGRGWTYFAADFRGHGESSGKLLDLRGGALQADLDLVADFLSGRGVRRLFLVGSSMGGWASAWFALRRRELVGACVLLAPALSFPHARWQALSDEERERWRRTGRVRVRNLHLDVEVGYGLIEEMNDFSPARLEAEFDTPALLVHGLRDEDVPYGGSVTFLERAACKRLELLLIKDANHRLEGYEAELARAACGFFANRGERT
jgi:abhydrolase domain-containing protein 10